MTQFPFSLRSSRGLAVALGTIVCTLGFPGAVCAQTPAPIAPAAPVPVAPAAPADAPKTPVADPGGEKRLEQVLALKFDRTPHIVLLAQRKLGEGSYPPDSVEGFRLRMLAGRFAEPADFLGTLPPHGRVRAFESILKALDQAPSAPGQQAGGPERSSLLLPVDIADLCEMAPGPPTADQVKLLAALLKRALGAGQSLDPLIERMKKGTKWLGGTVAAKQERAGDLLLETGRNKEALQFMPNVEPGKESASYPLLEKRAKLLFLSGRQEQAMDHMLEALRLNVLMAQAADCPEAIRDRSFRRVVDCARWCLPEAATATFQTFCDLGTPGVSMLLQQVANQVHDDRWARDANLRRANVVLQRGAVDAVLRSKVESADVGTALNEYALTWVDEAAYARKLYVPPRPQNAGTLYDRFGNPMAPPAEPQGNPNQPKPVAMEDLLQNAPDAEWRSKLDAALRPRVLALQAELALKVDQDAVALPLVEELAPLDGKEGTRLANEILRVWTRTRAPGRAQNQNQNFPTYNGTPAIPLTRAVQRRNLEALSAMYKRLRALGLVLDHGVLVNAFVRAHSPAEVYQQEAIESALGKMETIDLWLLADLLQAMRARLAGQWRKPAVQQNAMTQRTDAQMDAEVESGYKLVMGLVEKGLTREPENWRLNLASATTRYDWAEFRYGRKVDLAIYVKMREAAFAAFARAADCYARQLPQMERKDESAAAYQQWLNALLGASDLGQVTRQQDPDSAGLRTIREAIGQLRGDAGPRHLDMLAKSASSAANEVPSHLKPIYLKAALAVVGDRKDAEKMREAVDYYAGLMQEIELDARVDGDSAVGHRSPFGVFLTLHHTAEIERESGGGFARFLRNDSQAAGYYGFAGMPSSDARDLLEKDLRKRLGDRFEIVSISFHDAKVQSYGYGRAGWRETPLAYLLLKAKEPSVDQIPALQLNMDFMDRFGVVVLPVVTAVQLVDAKTNQPPARPAANIEVTQILDERALGEGKLSLEVKATCSGLVPKFEELFEFDPGMFKIAEKSDGGPAVQRLSSEGSTLAAISERTWLIKLVYDPSEAGGSQASFTFPKAKVPDVKVAYKEYRDVDLVEVSPEVALAGLPLGHSSVLRWALLGGGVVAAVGAAAAWRRRRARPAVTAPASPSAPSVVTPFTTLQFLRTLHGARDLRLPDQVQSELGETIARVEAFYFAAPGDGKAAPDLAEIVSTWLNRSTVGNVRT